jgi:hypothetical protein
VSAKFELDNGKTKEFPTWWTKYGAEGYYPDKPYCTKCGLQIKKNPKNYACDHLECAIYAAREDAIFHVGMICTLFFMYIVFGWSEEGDPLAVIREMGGFFIMFSPICLLMSLFPFKRWLELREYKNHGTIHGRMARRL